MNLVLITIDCLRADHVGYHGYAKPTTPFLDHLAHTSLIAENALVAGTPTYYSFPAIMASRYPLAHGRDIIGLAPHEPTLATVLQAADYKTAAFIAGNPYLTRHFQYHHGFDTFEDFLPLYQPPPAPPSRRAALTTHLSEWPLIGRLFKALYFQTRVKPRLKPDSLRQYPAAHKIIDRALNWLYRVQNRPFMLWLHLMDPHHPYYPPQAALAALGEKNRALYLNMHWGQKKNRADVIGLYDAGIRWVDMQIERFVKTLQERRKWDNTLLVMIGDHGEAFLEQDLIYHPPVKLPQALLHVPLLMHPADGHLMTPFSSLDLAPTILTLLGQPLPTTFQGRPFGAGREVAVTEVVYNARNPWRTEDRMGARLMAVQDGQYKLVINFATQTEQFFDVRAQELPLNAPPPSARHLYQAAYAHLTAPHPPAGYRLGAKLAQLFT